MSNEGEFPWSWLQWGPHLILERERKKYVVACWRPPKKLEIRHFHVAVGQGRQRIVQKNAMHVQSCWFAQQPYCFLNVFVAVAVVVAKALYYPTQGYNNRSTAQLVRMDKQLLFLFLLYAHYTIKRPLTYVIANLPECVVVCKASHKNVSSVCRLADCTLEKQLSTQENWI